MAGGQETKLGGKVSRQGERTVGVAPVPLVLDSYPCNRVWIGPATARHPGGANTGDLMIGAGGATVTLSANPADADTVTISDGVTSKVFEFDSGGAVAGTNVLVTIGATTDVTLDNLLKAIHTQRAAGYRVEGYRISATVLNLIHVAVISDASANTTAVVSRAGDIVVALGTVGGVFIDVDDARDLYLTGQNAGDDAEYQIFE